MSKFKIFSIALLAASAVGKAQELDPALKAIDAEQFEKAKTLLKEVIASKPNNGRADYLLGNVYLKQGVEDSARIYFQKGLSASDNAKFNNAGLGQIDLDNGNVAAAKAKFDLVTKDVRKKDVQEYVDVARAYINSSKPDYKAAIALLLKAKQNNPNNAELLLTLGDAYYGDKNQNDAYAAYRDAYAADNNLIRAKMQLGVLLKGAKAYDEAIKRFDDVMAINSNYGPLYRELAETYYLWAKNKPNTYQENIKKALSNYEKYMQLTDYSLSSRMRHADFLISANDYKALEVEAEQMKKLDKVNPRILRYLGYAAYENGNPDAAISALTDYTSKGTNKIISGDYYYLGLAQIAKSVSADGKVDATLLNNGLANIKKTLDMDAPMANALNEVGKKYFNQKQYGIASQLFEMAIANPEVRDYLEDNVYYGLCVLTLNRGKDAKTIDMPSLVKADKAMDNVIVGNPDYQEAYLYKARINNTMDKDDLMAANYQKYIDMISAKGADEITKNKTKLAESYNSIAAFYANTNKAKAIETFNKTLAIDPTNAYALDSVKKLK